MRGKGHLFVIATMIGFLIAGPHSLIIIGGWIFLLALAYCKRRLRLIECFILFVTSVFFAWYFPDVEMIDKPPNQDFVQITGTIQQINQIRQHYSSFVVIEEQTDQSIQINNFSANQPSLVMGATCHLTGEVVLPSQATNPGQFDYRAYLARQNIHYQLNINDANQIHCQGGHFIGKGVELRHTLMDRINQSLSPATASWLNAITLGNRDGIDQDYIELFQRWHLSHVLAISGLHLSIVIMILTLLLIHIGYLTKERSSQVLFVFLSVFPFFTGGSPSVWRASLVSALSFFTLFNQFKLARHDYLSLSFLCLLIVNPQWIYHLGFQFSYLVTFSLILSRKLLKRLTHPLLKGYFIGALSMLVVLPLQIQRFYYLNPLSLVVNPLFSGYFTLFVIPFLFLILFAFLLFPSLAQLLDVIFFTIHEPILKLLLTIDDHLFDPLILGEFPCYSLVLYYLALFMLMYALEQKNKPTCWLALISILIIVGFQQIKPYISPFGKITMLDLGQANALVMELPYRQGVIIYDLGARPDFDFVTASNQVYQEVIKPYLYQSGIKHIDAIILSHDDLDHTGSLDYLLEDFSVETIITSYFFQGSEQILTLIKPTNIKYNKVKAGQAFNIGPQSFFVLSPSQDWGNENDNSLVLLTQFANMNWLLTGDISEQVELKMVQAPFKYHIDVLSVAHHGSASSTSAPFLEQFQPDVALISVGRNNRYNHPSDDVISRLRSHQISIYRTDKHGAVQFLYHQNKPHGTFFTFYP